jgi:hypothetical protein
MIRNTVLAIAVLSSVASGFAAISPAPANIVTNKNVSVFYRNNLDTYALPLILDQCAKEDCSDTPSN